MKTIVFITAQTKFWLIFYIPTRICPSLCRRGTTWLSQNGFSWNFTFEYFPKIYL